MPNRCGGVCFSNAGELMNKRQKPLKCLSHEVYDDSLTPDQRTELIEAYKSFFEDLSPEDTKELRKYLMK